MPHLTFTTLDVFTSTRYTGNPVAVIHIPHNTLISGAQKQQIAREFNLSESVFLHEQTADQNRQGEVVIDIYTPFAEVPFAGHPTVGTANYLLRYLGRNEAKTLITKAGRIGVQRVELGNGEEGVRLALAHDVHVHACPFRGTEWERFPVVSIVKGMTFVLARLESLEELKEQKGNLVGMENTYTSQEVLDEGWRTGIVTTYFYVDMGRDQAGARCVRSRMFGSREDPATGSAASALCSYLSLMAYRDGLGDGEGLTTRYRITQGVEMGRKSEIEIQVTLTDDGEAVKEVLLSGTAVKVMEGKIEV